MSERGLEGAGGTVDSVASGDGAVGGKPTIAVTCTVSNESSGWGASVHAPLRVLLRHTQRAEGKQRKFEKEVPASFT